MRCIVASLFLVALLSVPLMARPGGDPSVALVDSGWVVCDGSCGTLLLNERVGRVYSIGNCNGYIEVHAFDMRLRHLWSAQNGELTGAVIHGAVTDSRGGVYIALFSQSYVHSLLKFEADGTPGWRKSYSNVGNRSNPAVAIDNDDHIYFLHRAYHSRLRSYPTSLLKLLPSGDTVWTRHRTGIIAEESTSLLAVDAEGSVYVNGKAYAGMTDYSTDIFTVKYSSGGEELWTARYDRGGRSMEAPTSIVADDAGIAIAGYSTTESGDFSFSVVRFDRSGAKQWEHIVEEAIARPQPLLYPVGDGSLYYTNNALATTDLITRLEADGSVAWKKRIAPDSTDTMNITHINTVSVITADRSGNLYVAGPGWPQWFWYSTMAFRSDGRRLWQTEFAGRDYYSRRIGSPHGIAIASNGDMYVGVTEDRYGPDTNDLLSCTVLRYEQNIPSSVASRTLADDEALAIWPNPARGETIVQWSQSSAGDVTIELLSLLGERLMERRLGHRESGDQKYLLDIPDAMLDAGVYLLRIRAGDRAQVGRMMLVK